MNYGQFMTRAIEVLRRHRSLWVLGFFWALVGGTSTWSGGGGNFGSVFNWSSGSDEVPESLQSLGRQLQAIPTEQWIAIGIGLGCVALVLIVVTTVLRYVLQAGIYRSLDELERSGLAPTVRGAWHEGWHRRTWRLWLQNVVVGVPFTLVLVLTVLPVIIPVMFMVGAEGRAGAQVLAGMSIATYCCLWMLLVFVAGTILTVLKQLWWRFAVLEDQGVLAAIGSGWRLGRANARSLLVLWLVLLVVSFAWFALFVAVLIVFGALTALVAGGPAFLLYRGTESLLWPLMWGLPVGFLTLVVPLILAGGLYEVFLASVWNQAFRHLAGPPAAPAPVVSGPPPLAVPDEAPA